jgi:predicted dehydrogenase
MCAVAQRADASAERLRVGVIGTGFGKQHVRAFDAHPRATVTAVCSTDPARAAAVAADPGVPGPFGDYRAPPDDRSVDAVVGTAPPDRHVAIAALGRVWSTAGIRQQPEFRTFCNAFGSRGSCLASPQRDPVELHLDRGVPGVGGPQPVPFQPGFSPNRALLDDWIAAIEADTAPRSGVPEALRSTAVIEAAMRSVTSGRFEAVAVPAD